MHILKIHSLSMGEAHSRLLAYIASPTSPPYVDKQLTALFHTQPLLKYFVYSIAAPIVNCVFYLKPSPALQAPCYCHQLGLADGHETWAYPTNRFSATVALVLLLDTNLLPQAGITHYSQWQHSTKLLCKKRKNVNLSLSSKFQPPHGGLCQATS